MTLDIATPVTRNLDLGHGDHLIEFEAPDEMIGGMQPAQFFMIGVPGTDTLLRRPFSVCGLPGTFDDARPGRAQVLYRVYGRGTRLLASLKPGAKIHVLGPLGHGFEPPEQAATRPVLVAGGIGSAPFPAFIASLRGSTAPAPWMFYGAGTAAELPLLGWFRDHCDRVEVATEDGSSGSRGLVTEPLLAWLDAGDRGAVELYACGPEPMLRATASLAVERGVPCQLALEAHMACGFGVCIGCVVPTRGPDGDVRYDRVCVEGPVMRAERMAW